MTMTNYRALKSGLSRTVQLKQLSKWNDDLALQTIHWIAAMINEPLTIASDVTRYDALVTLLKDGILFCKVMNVLRPEAPIKYIVKEYVWDYYENIARFLRAAVEYGLQSHETFDPLDLLEAGSSDLPGGNLLQVITCLVALDRKARSNGFQCSVRLGPKESRRNLRTFSRDVLDHGKAVISAQYGRSRSPLLKPNKAFRNIIMTGYDYRWRAREAPVNHIRSPLTTPLQTPQDGPIIYVYRGLTHVTKLPMEDNPAAYRTVPTSRSENFISLSKPM